MIFELCEFMAIFGVVHFQSHCGPNPISLHFLDHVYRAVAEVEFDVFFHFVVLVCH